MSAFGRHLYLYTHPVLESHTDLSLDYAASSSDSPAAWGSVQYSSVTDFTLCSDVLEFYCDVGFSLTLDAVPSTQIDVVIRLENLTDRTTALEHTGFGEVSQTYQGVRGDQMRLTVEANASTNIFPDEFPGGLHATVGIVTRMGRPECNNNLICDLDEPDCNGNGIPDNCDLSDGTSQDCSGDGVPDECEDCNGNTNPDVSDISSGLSGDCNDNCVPDECEPSDDCNDNGIQDLCDLASGESPDCNSSGIPDECEPGGLEDCNNNGVPDLCDIDGGTSGDCDENAVPDECDLAAGGQDLDGDQVLDICQGAPGPGDGFLKSRYLTITPFYTEYRTIKVTILQMDQYPEREGEVWWAGPEVAIPDPPHEDLRGAALQCASTPYVQNLTPGNLHLFGGAIIPSTSEYTNRYAVEVCAHDGLYCSRPFIVETARRGELSGVPTGGNPDFNDISACVQKYIADSAAPSITLADQVGTAPPGTGIDVPNQRVDFRDIATTVDAFLGHGYPNDVPACP